MAPLLHSPTAQIDEGRDTQPIDVGNPTSDNPGYAKRRRTNVSFVSVRRSSTPMPHGPVRQGAARIRIGAASDWPSPSFVKRDIGALIRLPGSWRTRAAHKMKAMRVSNYTFSSGLRPRAKRTWTCSRPCRNNSVSCWFKRRGRSTTLSSTISRALQRKIRTAYLVSGAIRLNRQQ